MFWSGDVPWDKYTIVLDEGSHDIEWKFIRSETSSDPKVFAQIDCATLSQINSSVVEESHIADYTLIRSYPNPFNPTTTLHFEKSLSETVRAEIFNSKGEIVKFFNLDCVKGSNRLNLDLHGYNSGIYFMILKDRQNSIIGSHKLTLIK